MSEETSSVQAMAILSMVFGGLSLFILAIIFAPASIVLGVISGYKDNPFGWIGMGLGILGLIFWAIVFLY